MTAVSVLETQQCMHRAVAAEGACTLAPATARSLRATAPVLLRVLRGRAWLTLGSGPGGWLADSGDLVLHAGQSVRLQPGQHVVLEPLDDHPLQWQWRSAQEPAAHDHPARAAGPAAQVCGA